MLLPLVASQTFAITADASLAISRLFSFCYGSLSLSFFLCYGFIFTFFHRAFALEHSPERKRATKKGLKREYERNKNKTTDDDEDRQLYTCMAAHFATADY